MQKLKKNNKTRKESKLQIVHENIIKYLSNQGTKPESEKERKRVTMQETKKVTKL